MKRVPNDGIAVYDGQEFIGTVVPRGRNAYEAFNSDGDVVGVFADEDSAATAVWHRSRTRARPASTRNEGVH